MSFESFTDAPAVEVEEVVQHDRRRRRNKDMKVIRLGKHPPEITKRTDAQVRAWAVDLAADMEMGYYVDLKGKQWEPRPFVIVQIMRHMGYSESTAGESHDRPQWWPGTDALRRMVSLKVMLRQAQSKAGASSMPWLDAALAASVEELLDRLYKGARSIGDRELIDLTTKLARLQAESRKNGTGNVPGSGVPIPAGGAVAFQRVTETIMALPPEDQERARMAFERITEKGRAAIAAPVV